MFLTENYLFALQTYKLIPPNLYFNLSDPLQNAESNFLDSFGDIVYHTHHAIFALFLFVGPAFRQLMFGWCCGSDQAAKGFTQSTEG